jgi:hypothetical protein
MSTAHPETTNRASESVWPLRFSADLLRRPFGPIENIFIAFKLLENNSSWRQLVKQLPQCAPRVLERVRVVTPIAPARRNWKKSGVHHAELPKVFEHLRVFVVLNAVADGLQAYAGCGFG